MSYTIEYSNDLQIADFIPHGGNEELIYSHDSEVIAEGSAETGKTLAACWKSHLLLSKYAGAQGAILRKTQTSVYGSVIQTYERVIKDSPVRKYGGEKPEKYIYPNGSTLWVGGMDNKDRVLSSERDFIQTCQTEEFTLDDWEYLTTRTTGRSAVIKYPQIFGDCNPGGSKHWIKGRAQLGHLRLIHTTHRDNPTLWDGKDWTEQGRRTIASLSALSGVRRKRLFEGIWATAEGAIYDMFDPSVHVKVRDIGEMKSFGLGMDEGYTNPAVILLIGEDGDGRHHICKEFYQRGVLQSNIVLQALEWMRKYDIEVAAVDAAAAGLIADLVDAGVPARSSKGRVLDRIQSVQNRLKIQGDGLPRLTLDPSCENTINDFESRVWKPEKDEPIKENDHGTDAYEYYDNLTQKTGGVISLPSDW